MDLQNLFYIVAILFMLVIIGFALSFLILFYYLRKKLSHFTKAAAKPAEMVSEIGAGIMSKLGDSFKNWFSKSK